MNLKYTVYGDSAFDKKIDGDMKLISETVLAGVDKNDITALILGGGYGRGEGGVISHDGKMQLYNDYDFFVITENVSMQRRNELNRELYEISEGLTEKIGIDVDFGPAVNKSRIPKTTFTMMWYELKNGHYVIYGNKNLLKDIPDYDGKNMPISEAASLLLNRGVGLMLARNKLAKNPQKNELEFAERNIYKALMACGDSFLISEKKFIYSYQKRQALLNDCKQEGIIAKYNFKKHYSDSIDYKLRPPYQPSSKEKLVALLDNTIKIYKDILFFTYGDCTKTELNTFAEYVSALDKQTFTKQNIIKNILLNIKYIGVSPKNIKWYFRYPRYRLYYALPYFLFGESNMKKDVTQLLGLDTNVDKKQLFNRFMKLWERFN